MIISVASGKGGTGKTTVAVNMALSIKDTQLLDCDVEEPNAHILHNPNTLEERPVYVLNPSINEDKCSHCGKCAEHCQYHALFITQTGVLFFPELCHSCGLCTLVCPENAISMVKTPLRIVRIMPPQQ